MPAKSKPRAAGHRPGDKNKAEIALFLRSLVPSGHLKSEHQFHDVRLWRFDWAIPDLKLAVEYDGINTFGGHAGRHTSITGVSGDHEKLNQAALKGWRVIRFTKLYFDAKKRKELKLTDWKDLLQQAVGSHNLNPAPEQGVLL